MRDVIFATLEGPDICHAEGQEVVGQAPAIAMCHLLVGMGYDELRPMHVFRGGELVMTIKSIGWAVRAPGFVKNRRVSQSPQTPNRAPEAPPDA